ncbi:Acetyltransferase (GNAT) family protein [Botrimarina colliarenosi]|uniref:Acetyltransferase (GNAT) family protein n=1 Tax=Botrimarina colliarenosi TaxID=2528001 RepID=A0A5C6ALW1_9BACT|nr:GNAT family N-acetyltransferase [Botrimarina colliarenosi]TWU00468.1 Acetyltransferase (GNAT) family protein [Botrimarina colliarenosi]
MSGRFRLESLSGQDRSGFACGVAALDDYLHKRASQDQRRRVAACYLLVESETSRPAGYYTLSAASVLLSDLPEATAKKLPRYPSVPVVRVGRLAVDARYHGQKLGSVLVFDAVKRAAQSGVGAFAVVVDAKDQNAAAFYGHHGFTPLDSAGLTLFLPIGEGLQQMLRGG